MKVEKRHEPRYRLKVGAKRYWKNVETIDSYCLEHKIDYVYEIPTGKMQFFAPNISKQILHLLEVIEAYK